MKKSEYLKKYEVSYKVKHDSSWIYWAIKNKGFPAPFKFENDRTSYWLESEIDAWLKQLSSHRKKRKEICSRRRQ